MSQFLSIEIGNNFLVIVSGTKTGDSTFTVENVHREQIPFDMDSLKLSQTSQLSELIEMATSTWDVGNDLIVSFNGQSTFIRSVSIDKNVPKHLLMEHLEWEFEQVSGSSKKDFTFAIDEDNINNRHLSQMKNLFLKNQIPAQIPTLGGP